MRFTEFERRQIIYGLIDVRKTRYKNFIKRESELSNESKKEWTDHIHMIDDLIAKLISKWSPEYDSSE